MSRKGKYFIQEHLHREVFHGGIGNIDAEKIMQANGFRAIVFPFRESFSVKAKIARLIYLLRMFFFVKPGSYVVYQFPLHARIHKFLITLLRSLKDVKVVCFIADIEGMRDGDERLLQQEIRELRSNRYIIVHNERMRQWILSVAPGCATAEIEFFDYLAHPVQVNREKDNKIVFAGNLGKSGFITKIDMLYKTHPRLMFFLYGPGLPADIVLQEGNIVYKGIYDPYSLVQQLEGSFGLVWDGDSIEACSSSLGYYLAYNSPSKLSAYILAGLPVIAPGMSAAAYLIEKYNIGLVVNSLPEIEDKIAALSEEDYRQMVANTRRLAPRIAGGKSLPAALDALLEPATDNRD